MAANRDPPRNGPAPGNPSRMQLTYGRGAKNLTITGGTFYSTPGNVRRQQIRAGHEVTSRVILEDNEALHRGEQNNARPPRDIHFFDSPQGRMSISGGLHVLAGGHYVDESIGLPGSQQDHRWEASTDVYEDQQPQSPDAYSAFHTPYPASPAGHRPVAVRAKNTLFANARSDINISSGTYVGTLMGATKVTHPEGSSNIPITRMVEEATPNDVDIHIYPDVEGTTNLSGQTSFFVTAGPVLEINYIGENDAGIAHGGHDNDPASMDNDPAPPYA